MRAYILQHVAFESPGRIGPALDALGATVTVTKLFAGDRLPRVGNLDALVVMGGPMSVNDEAEFPWLAEEKALVAQAIAGDRAVLGVCLGAQVIASALGYRVFTNAEREIGWFPIQATPAGRLRGLEVAWPVFHWHGETFELPEGAELLASSEGCVNQAFALGPRVLGLQFHLEVGPDDVRRMSDHGRHELTSGRFVQTADQMLATPAERYPAMNAMIDTLFNDLIR